MYANLYIVQEGNPQFICKNFAIFQNFGGTSKMEIPTRLKNLALVGGAACTMLGGISSHASTLTFLRKLFLLVGCQGCILCKILW